MKEILLFTHHLVQGGAEKTVRSLAMYLNRPANGIQANAFHASIAVVYDDKAMHEALEMQGVPVIVLQNRNADRGERQENKLRKAMTVLLQVREMRELKRRLQIDVCVSFLPGADLINVLSGTGEARFISVRNCDSYFYRGRLSRAYLRLTYRRCDRIIAVSGAVKKDVSDLCPSCVDKIVLIPNAVPEEPPCCGGACRHTDGSPSGENALEHPEQWITESVTADFLHLSAGKRVFLNVARLAREKGQVLLIRAFCRVHESLPDTCLVLVGEGPCRSELELEISRLHLEDCVLLAGRKDNPMDYMRLSDVFVLSSFVEGMPNVVLEAMQCGLPVLATDCGSRDILDQDADDLYGKLREIVSLPEQIPVWGEAAYRNICEHYTFRNYYDALREHGLIR